MRKRERMRHPGAVEPFNRRFDWLLDWIFMGQEGPNPTEQCRDENRVGKEWQWRALGVQRHPAKYLDRGRNEQGGGGEAEEPDKLRINAWPADQKQAGSPEADSCPKGRTAGREVHRRAGQQQSFPHRKHNVSGRNEILALAEKKNGQQRARHDEGSSVDTP